MIETAARSTAPEAGALAGLRVLELGSLIAGPLATRLLGDLGAEVIKAEAPGKGDPMREWGTGEVDGRKLWWPLQSRSKRLITLNLRSPEGQELCRELLTRCDVLVENFRPGTMERWGLGPDEVAALNPDLVYARVSGYGQTGPYAARPGFASAGEAMGGLRHLNGFPGGPPPRTGLSLGDTLSAMFTAIGVLAALRHRDQGGGGQVVDASIVESCFAMLESVAPEYDRLGQVREASGTGLSNNAPSNIYRSRDGKWVVIAANSDNLWRRLCAAIEREELADDPRFAGHTVRSENSAELDELIGDWASGLDAAEISERLNAADVVCSPVYTIADIFADPHVAARQMLVEIEDEQLGPVVGPSVVPKLSATPGPSRFRSGWEMGADNEDIYGGLLGLDPARREELAGIGAI